MRSLFQVFDEYMTRHNRKLTLYDIYGNEVLHKYCLLRRETPDDVVTAKHSRLPALYLHKFMLQHSPDGPASHSHPGTTISFILKGWYKEKYKDKLIDRKRWSFNMVKWPEPHKIVEVMPGTWTVFFRWFVRENNVKIVPETCTNICDYCKDNYGQCFNIGKTFEYDMYAKQFDTTKENSHKFSTWYVAGPVTDKIIARRRAAMLKLKRYAPKSAEEQLENGRQYTKLPSMFELKKDLTSINT